MDPLLINESSFSAANLSSYSLADIWPPHSALGLRVGSLGESGNHGESVSVEASSATERISRGKKRKEAPAELEGEDGSSRMGSAGGGGGTNSSKLSAKNAEIRGSQDEDCTPRPEGQTDGAAARRRLSDQTSRPTEPPEDYIHVRARRGQATDSHSLAERARREKISERMRILQEIVPGCNKVIGKALILDRIINYIQSLQHQVEFLSMKVEAVNSRMNMNATVDGFHPKDPFDATGVMFAPQSARDHAAAPQPQWLHMQIGNNFERPK